MKILRRRDKTTVAELADTYLATHDVDPATLEKLRRQLKRAVVAFGTREIASLTTAELRAWRQTLPEGYRHDLFRARRMGTSLQMIDQTYGHLTRDADVAERGLLDVFDDEVAA